MHANRHAGVAALALLAACSPGKGDPYDPGTDLPANEADAARMVQQATFGVDDASLRRLMYLGYTTWLREQFEKPASLHRPWLQEQLDLGATLSQRHRVTRWWQLAIQGEDQLRQRVAFALSEILVISDRGGGLESDVLGGASYYDLLVTGAFGSYRELLEAVTLSPQMGVYLSMLRNRKPDLARNIQPDENYAREIMQLFSIGLVKLREDGTPELDSNNQEIPTYDQDVIVGIAHAFTGWNYARATSWGGATPNHLPMEPWEDYHDRNAKLVLDGRVLPQARSAREELLDILDQLAAHPNVGPFLGKQLIQRLVTSNPSPAYVGRIARVWADNGSGQRGDLRAVVQAILLDDEARNGHRTAPVTFGKLREPLLRQTALWRAFKARAADGLYDDLADPSNTFGQGPLQAQTVFNFFRPDHRPPGPVADAGLLGPEFQILTHSLITSTTNAYESQVFRGHVGYASARPDQVLLDLSAERALAADPAALVARLDRLLLAGQMTPEMRNVVTNHVSAEPLANGNGLQRALEAVYLVISSPEFAIQK